MSSNASSISLHGSAQDSPATVARKTLRPRSRARLSGHDRARDSPAKVARDSSQPQSRAIPLSYSRFPEPQSRVILSPTSRARLSATVTASPPPPVAHQIHYLQSHQELVPIISCKLKIFMTQNKPTELKYILRESISFHCPVDLVDYEGSSKAAKGIPIPC
ncbi:Uncharacterized protein Fot_40494 [Forsythia ovata]|uniref:Uncharacterized protein n=1 Tax=Forsythia ovata TaxID=205694 RepID=A0ABD1S7K7_9LAMI